MEMLVRRSMITQPRALIKRTPDDRVRAIAKAMGLTIVIWTEGYDTAGKPIPNSPKLETTHAYNSTDWSINTSGNSQDLFNGYKKMLDSFPTLDMGVISLQHDWYQATVDLAVGYFWPAAYVVFILFAELKVN